MSNGAPSSSSLRGARAALAVGALAIALAGALSLARCQAPLAPVRITGGPAGTSRDLIAQGLAARLDATGLPTEIVHVTGDELARLDGREMDLALVSSALRSREYAGVREVAPLHAEALHVLVKEELAGDVGETLRGLRGRRVDVGPVDSAGAALSRAVLAFAGLDDSAAGGAIVEQVELAELERRIAAGERDALSDAVFHLATVPSRIALELVRTFGYRLVPLPFADAFRLRTLLAEAERGTFAAGRLDLADVASVEIPAFTYRTDPASPPEPLPTLGATLLLLAHDEVAPEAIEHLLGVVYGSQFARLAHPPLERRELGGRPRLRRHAGTSAFLARHEPILSARDVDQLNNTLGVAGALVGGVLFLWQGLRQARASRRDRLFAGHMLRVAGIEQRLVEQELSSELDLEGLIALQRELLELKREALGRFAAGELGDHRAIAELLAPVDVAREHVAALLLHVRERVAERAEAEGKTVAAVWKEEAAAGPE